MHHFLTSKTIFQHSTRVEHSSLHRNHSACMLALVIVKSLCLSGCFCVNVVLDYLGRNWRTPSLRRLNITWWSVERCGSSRWASWVVSCVRPNKEDYINLMGELSIMLNVTFYCTVITVDPQRRYGVIVLTSLMLKSSVISDLFSAVCMFWRALYEYDLFLTASSLDGGLRWWWRWWWHTRETLTEAYY